ncbi:MAG: hypothetical protein HY079_15000 [Elusimicrobia bacterium]|nr:hypothetical protein [Elusimicrobiota bacterium]
MDKKFKVKLTGPGLDLEAPVSEGQAKTIFNIAFGTDLHSVSAALAPAQPPGQHAPILGDNPSPRDFVAAKTPMTEQERLTCLAYYLYKYRKVEKFTSKEIKDLNSEAAQPKFNNTSYTARDATDSGYLAAVGGGKKMLSALGERVVDAMPDRQLVADVMKKYGKKSRRK